MNSIQAIRKGNRFQVAALLLLLTLFSGEGSSALAQKSERVAPDAQSSSRQIAGKRGTASRSVVVNVSKLSRKESLTSSSVEQESEEIEPPEEIPQSMPVPMGAPSSMEKRAAPQSITSAAATIGPSPGASASFLASDDTGRIPPDTHGAVGPNHLVVVHNGRVRIQNRAGNVISSVTLVSFWSSLTNAPTDIFDPRVLYDPYGNRWMMISAATRTSANSSILIGVSQTSDPTGNWNLYRVDADSADILWADFPSIGFNKNWIVVHANMFPIVDGPGFISHFYVFNKANLYAGGQGLYTLIKAPNLGGSIVPAITYDSAISTLYLLQNWNGSSNGSGYLGLYSITGAVGSEVLNVANTTSPTLIGTPNPWASDAPTVSGTDDFAPQLATTLKVQNNDSRIQNVVYRNGALWCVQTVFLPAGSSPTRTAIQWWQISTSGTAMQRGRIDDATGNTFYAFPSIAVNSANDVLVGYSRYSASQFVTANYSFRAGTDPLSSLRDDTVLKAGEASYFKTGSATPPRNRWGDYSSTVVDPANDKDMWTIQEYAATPAGGTDKWGTWWGRISSLSAAPTLQLNAASYTVSEGAAHQDVVVTRSGDTSIAATINYATSDTAGLTNCNVVNTGIASSRCDYAASVGTLRFAIGETSKTISIPIVNDSYAEGTESFTITLSNPGGATLGSTTIATIAITDNDTTTGANPVDTTAFFVRQHYIDFLGREPDPVGFQGWQDTLNNCAAGDIRCDRIEVSSGFFRSTEFQERGYFTYRFYSVALGRKPDYSEFMPDLAKVSGFLTDAEKEANKVAFVDEFMARTTFKSKYDALTTPTAYVDALLQTAGLLTHPSRAGWIAGLTNGTLTRAQVLRQLAESSEAYSKFYNEAFVVMQYFGYLRRDPDAAYLDWIKSMNQNNDYRGMINGFMNSAEYRRRFGP
ncbi:MAG: hypothetical protein QOH63_502 [Acidobacteriota bacterium]|jgi:hypothetical protein|nr:hypothetical protein [Acidobacteriota bacterium]